MRRKLNKLLGLMLCAILVAGIPLGALAADAPEGAKTIVLYNNSGAGNGAGQEAGSTDAGYDMVQQYIYDKTGVWLDGMLGVGSEATTQLQLMLAGGTQIDLWWGNWRTYEDSGIIQPWNELLEANQGLWDAWEPWNAWAGMTDQDGNIWGMPRSTPTTPYQIFVRQDWLDLVGMAQPSTVEELNAYLYAIKELDPYGNGGTVPLGVRSFGEVVNSFLAGYTGMGNGEWYDEESSQVMPIYLADGYKDFLAQIHQWYADGIIHRESFSWDADTLRDYISRGTVGATATWYSNITGRELSLYEALREKGVALDSSKYTYLYDISETGITGPSGTYIETYTAPSSNGLLMHVKCVDPEGAVKFLSWMFEDWYNFQSGGTGLENIHWRYNPDDPNAVENNSVSGWTDENGVAMYIDVNGEVSYTNSTLYAGNFQAGYGMPNEIKTTAYEQETGRQQMHNYWMQNNLNKFDTAMAPGLNMLGIWDGIALAENVPHNGDISTYFNQEVIKFVLGTRALDEWDQFVDELYKIGLQDRIDEYTRQYQAYLAAK